MATLNRVQTKKDVRKPDLKKEGNSLDQDFIVPLKPKKIYKVKATIKTVEKHYPKIFFE
jgi:hypothetical protein